MSNNDKISEIKTKINSLNGRIESFKNDISLLEDHLNELLEAEEEEGDTE